VTGVSPWISRLHFCFRAQSVCSNGASGVSMMLNPRHFSSDTAEFHLSFPEAVSHSPSMSRLSTTGVGPARGRPKNRRSRPGVPVYTYRHYDPVTGRWPSRDPIAEAGGNNLYGFVKNGGFNKYDRLGLESLCDTCDKGKKEGEEDPRVKKMIVYMTEMKCTLPSVTCRCKKDDEKIGTGGIHSGQNHTITLFCNSTSGSGYFKELTVHEYQHASDDCRGLKPTDCERRACAEIRAYEVAQCSTEIDPVKKADCVRKNAEESVRLGGCRDAEKWVQKAWAECYGSL
jgi:RHS repeat-associated protein